MVRNDFFTQSESQEIFVNGILQGTDEVGVTQKKLTETATKVIGQLGRSTVTGEQMKEVEKKCEKFHHWFMMHEGLHHPSENESITVGHTEKLSGGVYDCNLLTDEWFKWFFTTPRSRNPYSNPGQGIKDENQPYGQENVFLMQKRGANVYFTTATPFQETDVKSITLRTEAALLVPAYNVFVAKEMFPALDNNDKLLVEIISDLLGIRSSSVNAQLDGQNVEPCCVVRQNPIPISGIPIDNVYGIPQDRLAESNFTINLLHGGFWMLLRPQVIGSGDHLLEFEVNSVNYKMKVELRINALI